MPISTYQAQVHRFTGMPDLEDVQLYIEQEETTCRFTFVCFANAWTAYFSDLQEHESAIDRLLLTPTPSMVRAIQWGTAPLLNKDKNRETAYLRHIVECIKDEISAYIKLQTAKCTAS